MKRWTAIYRFVLILLMFAASYGSLIAQDAAPSNNAAVITRGANFANVDEIMNAAVAQGTIPGGVVLIGHNGAVVYRKAYGMRSLEPGREAMTVDTIFDLASLTKCIATATSVMKLVQEGKVRLNDTVAVYLPKFAKYGKSDITVRELLTHFSGLTEDLDLKTAWKGRDAAFQMVMDQKPVLPPGSRFLYSDINFETLGLLVEKVSGMSLDEYAAKNIFTPAGDERDALSAARRMASAHRADGVRRKPSYDARHGA